MRRLAARLGLGLVIGAAVAGTPSAALACTSEQPTFAQAVHGAKAIARVRIVEGWDGYQQDPTHSETYRVEHVIKGSLPDLVTLAPAWTTTCHDSVASYAAEGDEVIIAFDLRFSGDRIHPMWAVMGAEGVLGSAGQPAGIDSLDELEAAIRTELGLPDTATPAPSASGPGPSSALLVAAAVAGFVLAGRRLRGRRIRHLLAVLAVMAVVARLCQRRRADGPHRVAGSNGGDDPATVSDRESLTSGAGDDGPASRRADHREARTRHDAPHRRSRRRTGPRLV